jgi:hypothetical protein
MTVQTVKLAGKRFVILPEEAYKDLERRAKAARSRSASRGKAQGPRRMVAAELERLEDEADVKAARAALREKGAIPWDRVKAELGLRGLGREENTSATRKRTA